MVSSLLHGKLDALAALSFQGAANVSPRLFKTYGVWFGTTSTSWAGDTDLSTFQFQNGLDPRNQDETVLIPAISSKIRGFCEGYS
jgi:hypothetical protein